MNNLILYGIGNAKYQYRVLKYFCIYDEHIDIAETYRTHDANGKSKHRAYIFDQQSIWLKT